MLDHGHPVWQRPPFILMYHSVSTLLGSDPYHLRVNLDRFEQQLGFLQRQGRRGVSISELLDAEESGTAASLIGLTFDDGFADFAECAVPILARFGFTATVFVVAGRLSGDNAWDPEPRLPLMSAEQVRAVRRAGHEVGSHSNRHVELSGAEPAELRREIGESRQRLEGLLSEPVTGFCFPYGSLDDPAVLAVEEAGYRYACATDSYSRPGRYCLPRSFVGQRDGGFRLRVKELRHRARSAGILPRS